MSWIDWLRPALEEVTEAELLADIQAGKAQLWPGETAAMVTQCVADGEGRSLHVWLAGGDLPGVLALKPGVEAWARAQGCEFVSIEGRPGWARLLRDDGYRRVGRELRKAL